MLWRIVLPFTALMLLIVVVRVVRRLRPTRIDATNYDFTIEQLLRLRQAGELSDEEFERAKAEVISRKAVEPSDPTKRGFEVLQGPQPTLQALEDRTTP